MAEVVGMTMIIMHLTFEKLDKYPKFCSKNDLIKELYSLHFPGVLYAEYKDSIGYNISQVNNEHNS